MPCLILADTKLLGKEIQFISLETQGKFETDYVVSQKQ